MQNDAASFATKKKRIASLQKHGKGSWLEVLGWLAWGLDPRCVRASSAYWMPKKKTDVAYPPKKNAAANLQFQERCRSSSILTPPWKNLKGGRKIEEEFLARNGVTGLARSKWAGLAALNPKEGNCKYLKRSMVRIWK